VSVPLAAAVFLPSRDFALTPAIAGGMIERCSIIVVPQLVVVVSLLSGSEAQEESIAVQV